MNFLFYFHFAKSTVLAQNNYHEVKENMQIFYIAKNRGVIFRFLHLELLIWRLVFIFSTAAPPMI